jgi:hypothetical protein
VLAGLLVTMALLALTFNRAARIAPLLIGVPAALLAVANLVSVARGTGPVGRRGPAAGAAARVLAEMPRPAMPTAPEPTQAPIGRSLAWLALLVVLFFTLGQRLAAPVYLVAYLRLNAKESWRTTLLITGAVVGLLWVLFETVLGVGVYPGLVGRLFQ